MVGTTHDVNIRARFNGRDVSRGTQQVNKDMKRMSKTAKTMQVDFKKLAGFIGLAVGAEMVRQVIQTADAWTSYANRIKLFTSSAKEAKKVSEDLFKIAQRTNQDFGGTVELFQRLAQSNKQLGLSQRELLGVLETLNQTIVISGTSAESAKAGLIQLGQGLAAGTLRGDELNSVMEQMPRLSMALAAGMGVGIGKLREMGQAGEITAQRVIQALQSQSTVVGEEYKVMTQTVGQAMTQMGNSLGRAVSQLNSAANATNSLAEKIALLAAEIDKIPWEEVGNFLVGPDLSRLDPREWQSGGKHHIGPSFTQEQIASASFIGPTKDQLGPNRIPFLEWLHEQGQAAEDAKWTGKSQLKLGRGPGKGFDWAAGALVDDFNTSTKDFLSGLKSQGLMGMQGIGSGQGDAADTAEQIQLRARALESLTTNEQHLLAIRQEAEMQIARMTHGPNSEYVRVLGETHAAEGKKVSDLLALAEQQKKNNDLTSEQIKVESAKAMVLGRVANALSIVHPRLGKLASGLINLKKELDTIKKAGGALSAGGAIGVGLAIYSVWDAVRSGTSAHDRYKESIQEVNNALVEQVQTLEAIALSAGGEFAKEVMGFKHEITSPVRDLFMSVRDLLPGTNIVDDLERYMELTAQFSTGHGIKSMAWVREGEDEDERRGRTHERNKQQKIIEAATKNEKEVILRIAELWTHDFVQNMLHAFGPVGSSEVIRQMFTIEKQFDGLATAASEAADALDPLKRAIRVTFDVKEMAIRREQQKQMTLAGADPQAQANVMKALGVGLTFLRRKEEAELRSISGGSGSRARTTTKARTQTDAVVEMGASNLNEMGVNNYEQIISFEGDVTKIHKPWSHVIRFQQSSLMDFRPVVTTWNDIVAIEGAVYKIPKPWASVINFERSNLSDWPMADGSVITRYSQIVNMGSVDKISKNWNHVIAFKRAPLSEFKTSEGEIVTKYSEIVNMGSLDRIPKQWSHVLAMGDRIKVYHWKHIYDIDNATAINVDISKVINLTGKKIQFTDLIDMGDLEAIVDGAVARNNKNRRSEKSSVNTYMKHNMNRYNRPSGQTT